MVVPVFKIPRSQPWPPAIDLATVRETLVYMKDDVARVPDLMRVKKALEIAIDEIDKAEQIPRSVSYVPRRLARFMPAPRRA